MLADIKGPHLDFFWGAQQPFTRLCWQPHNLALFSVRSWIQWINFRVKDLVVVHLLFELYLPHKKKIGKRSLDTPLRCHA